MHGDDVHDRRDDQQKKQRQVQDVPERKHAGENAEPDNFAGLDRISSANFAIDIRFF